MEKVSEEKKIFVERWDKVREQKGLALKSTAFLAREIGIKDDTFRRYTDPLNPSKPTMEALKKIALYCNVSVDYLLGITDIMSPDIRTREFCKLTGLSEAAFEKLKKTNHDNPESAKITSDLIEQDGFFHSVIAVVKEIIRKQSGQLRDNLPKDIIPSKGVISFQFAKMHNDGPIIDYEAQYDISKGTISSFEDVVRDRVCDKVYKSIK